MKNIGIKECGECGSRKECIEYVVAGFIFKRKVKICQTCLGRGIRKLKKNV